MIFSNERNSTKTEIYNIKSKYFLLLFINALVFLNKISLIGVTFRCSYAYLLLIVSRNNSN